MKCVEIPINILLADDDLDDRGLFAKALAELPIKTNLTMVHDGEQLMNYFSSSLNHTTDVLFLDLSMPGKTGVECLVEMKEQEKTKDIPVIMFSIFYQRDINYEQSLIKGLSNIGAYHYIRKTKDFEHFKKSICDAIMMVTNKNKAEKKIDQQ